MSEHAISITNMRMSDFYFLKIHIFQHFFVTILFQMAFCSLCNFGIMAAQSRKRAKYLSTGFNRHTRMLHQEIPVIPRIRQINYVFVIVDHKIPNSELRFVATDLFIAFARCRPFLHIHALENCIFSKALFDCDLRKHHFLFTFYFFHIREQVITFLRCA